MQDSQTRIPDWQSVDRIQNAVFFALFFVYLWKVLDLRLIYHGAGLISNFPVFFKGWTFFLDFTSHPGGMVQYVSAFLSQFFHYRWAGALIVTAQAWLLCACTDYLLKYMRAVGLRWLRFLPAIIIIILYSQYTYYFHILTAMLVALLCACLYAKIAAQNRRAGLPVFLALSASLYYVASAAFLLFAVICAIIELLFTFRFRLAVAYLLTAIVLPYVAGVLAFDISILDAFTFLTPFSWRILDDSLSRRMITAVWVLYLLIPLIALKHARWKDAFAKALPSRDEPLTGRNAGARAAGLNVVLMRVTPFALAAAAVLFSYDRKIEALFATDFYAWNADWPNVMRAAKGNPNHPLVIYAVDRALYNTGRLADDMFSLPQKRGTLLLDGYEYFIAYWNRFGLHYDLGLPHAAEHDLVESMGIFGPRPHVLRNLAMVKMIRGEIDAAKVYLMRLKKTLFDASWAEKYLAAIERDPTLSDVPEVQRIRSLMPDENVTYLQICPQDEEMFDALQKKNPRNRMAFEYMMASYLLAGNLDKFAENLILLRRLDYKSIPRSYQEAILLYQKTSQRKVDLQQPEISSAAEQEVDAFLQQYYSYMGDVRTARNEMKDRYGRTYCFYFYCDMSADK